MPNDEDEDEEDEEEDEDEESGLFDNLYQAPNAELDPKRRKGKKGHLNAGLRRWMAEHKRGGKTKHRRKHDPKHRYHRRKHDPKHRKHTFHRRKYDIMGMPPMWSAALTPLAVAAGTWLHNFAYSRGWFKGSISLPLVNANITPAALGSGVLSSLLVYFGGGKPLPSLLAHVAAGAFGEGFNVPAIEGMQVSRGGTQMGGYGGLSIAEYAVARPY